jgi:hypothetical protein
MKSQQEEKRYQTNCLDCICAIYKDNEQTDCAIKRLDHFLERDEAYELQQEEKNRGASKYSQKNREIL